MVTMLSASPSVACLEIPQAAINSDNKIQHLLMIVSLFVNKDIPAISHTLPVAVWKHPAIYECGTVLWCRFSGCR